MVKRLLLSALLVSWVVPAWAAPPARTKPTHTPSHTIVKTRLLKPQAAPARAGQKAAVDPETKKLREPTPDEQQATTPANVAPAAAIRENTYSDGSVQIELNDDYMTDVVAVRNADGTVTTTCVPRSAKAAPRASAPETK
ncbi:MAG TPA: hypothetical protein VKE22_15195 [Haliangiales bacterium]|nr:hypothetical protein [Haliangiales bacterium]